MQNESDKGNPAMLTTNGITSWQNAVFARRDAIADALGVPRNSVPLSFVWVPFNLKSDGSPNPNWATNVQIVNLFNLQITFARNVAPGGVLQYLGIGDGHIAFTDFYDHVANPSSNPGWTETNQRDAAVYDRLGLPIQVSAFGLTIGGTNFAPGSSATLLQAPVTETSAATTGNGTSRPSAIDATSSTPTAAGSQLTSDDPSKVNSIEGVFSLIKRVDPWVERVRGPALNETRGLVSTTSSSVACYVGGTQIRCLDGDRDISKIQKGATVTTVFEGTSIVIWVGKRRLDLERHPTPSLVSPIRIKRGAFGTDKPYADLYVSPAHAFYLDGVLVPIRCLVNGTTIQWVPRRFVTYYYIELAHHDVVTANGVVAESWLDTGNRSMFENAPVIEMYPDFGKVTHLERGRCVQLVECGLVVADLQKWINRRTYPIPQYCLRRIFTKATVS